MALTSAALLLALLLVACHALYNVFLHPLRHRPGPVLWAATRMPWCYYQYKGCLPQQLLNLHLKYGHCVRVAPNELSYTDEQAWKIIYGQRKEEMMKDPHFRLHTPTGAQNILVADRETHSRQRRLLSHAFSESALREQEPILQTYSQKLINQLAREVESHSEALIDMSAWMIFFAFDLIGHMAFGENFACLDDGEHSPFVRSINSMAMELVFIQMWKYWRLFPLRNLLTPKKVTGQRKENIGIVMQTVARRIRNGSEHRDFLHYILSANDEKGMSPEEIHVNAFSLSIAGSESTSTALAGVIFLTLSHPEVRKRLVDEIRSNFDDETDITLTRTLDLKYLDAVITETLRIYPPVAITMPRRIPAGGETIAGEYVPAQTTVGIPLYAMFHSPENFHNPEVFMPERWLSDTHGDKKHALQPFSFGPRGCLGRNIARAEIRLLLAKLLFKFDMELADGQESWLRQKIWGFWQKPALLCKLSLAPKA